MSVACGVMHGDTCFVRDEHGCVLPESHEGPHEFVEADGQRWLWETDLECACPHCSRLEGDYCTVFWRKPA